MKSTITMKNQEESLTCGTVASQLIKKYIFLRALKMRWFVLILSDVSRFSEECLPYDVVGFERVTFRPCVRPSRVCGLNFRALDRVRAPSPRLLYSVGDCYMIQLNDSESLVSVLQVFLDHRARAPWRHTNLVLSPCMGPNPYSGSWPG